MFESDNTLFDENLSEKIKTAILNGKTNDARDLIQQAINWIRESMEDEINQEQCQSLIIILLLAVEVAITKHDDDFTKYIIDQIGIIGMFLPKYSGYRSTNILNNLAIVAAKKCALEEICKILLFDNQALLNFYKKEEGKDSLVSFVRTLLETISFEKIQIILKNQNFYALKELLFLDTTKMVCKTWGLDLEALASQQAHPIYVTPEKILDVLMAVDEKKFCESQDTEEKQYLDVVRNFRAKFLHSLENDVIGEIEKVAHGLSFFLGTENTFVGEGVFNELFNLVEFSAKLLKDLNLFKIALQDGNTTPNFDLFTVLDQRCREFGSKWMEVKSQLLQSLLNDRKNNPQGFFKLVDSWIQLSGEILFKSGYLEFFQKPENKDFFYSLLKEIEFDANKKNLKTQGSYSLISWAVICNRPHIEIFNLVDVAVEHWVKNKTGEDEHFKNSKQLLSCIAEAMHFAMLLDNTEAFEALLGAFLFAKEKLFSIQKLDQQNVSQKSPSFNDCIPEKNSAMRSLLATEKYKGNNKYRKVLDNRRSLQDKILDLLKNISDSRRFEKAAPLFLETKENLLSTHTIENMTLVEWTVVYHQIDVLNFLLSVGAPHTLDLSQRFCIDPNGQALKDKTLFEAAIFLGNPRIVWALVKYSDAFQEEWLKPDVFLNFLRSVSSDHFQYFDEEMDKRKDALQALILCFFSKWNKQLLAWINEMDLKDPALEMLCIHFLEAQTSQTSALKEIRKILDSKLKLKMEYESSVPKSESIDCNDGREIADPSKEPFSASEWDQILALQRGYQLPDFERIVSLNERRAVKEANLFKAYHVLMIAGEKGANDMLVERLLNSTFALMKKVGYTYDPESFVGNVKFAVYDEVIRYSICERNSVALAHYLNKPQIQDWYAKNPMQFKRLEAWMGQYGIVKDNNFFSTVLAIQLRDAEFAIGIPAMTGLFDQAYPIVGDNGASASSSIDPDCNNPISSEGSRKRKHEETSDLTTCLQWLDIEKNRHSLNLLQYSILQNEWQVVHSLLEDPKLSKADLLAEVPQSSPKCLVGKNSLDLAIMIGNLDVVAAVVQSFVSTECSLEWGKFLELCAVVARMEVHAVPSTERQNYLLKIMNHFFEQLKDIRVLSQKNEEGCAAVHYLAESGMDSVLDGLLKKLKDGGIPRNVGCITKDANRETALHRAIRLGRIECAAKLLQFMIEHGVDLNKTNQQGQTPLALAQERRDITERGSPSYKRWNTLVKEMQSEGAYSLTLHSAVQMTDFSGSMWYPTSAPGSAGMGNASYTDTNSRQP